MAKRKRNKDIKLKPGAKLGDWFLYILELKTGKYYVGITKNPMRRFSQHDLGDGAMVTKIFPPIRAKGVYFIGRTSYHEAEKVENLATVFYMSKYGNRVWGGRWAGRNIPAIDKIIKMNPGGDPEKYLKKVNVNFKFSIEQNSPTAREVDESLAEKWDNKQGTPKKKCTRERAAILGLYDKSEVDSTVALLEWWEKERGIEDATFMEAREAIRRKGYYKKPIS